MKRMGITAAAMCALLLAGCGGGSDGNGDKDPGAKPKTFNMFGTMTLTSADVIGDGGDGCLGSGGYDDMRGGAAVVVYDADGKKVGIGELETGKASTTVTCVFDFSVTDIPDKGTIFSVEVAHRGEIPFKRDDAGNVALTLG